MATYKLIQDIEAEDHILGPLSFRQFVFALIGVFLGYMCFLVVVKHAAFLLAVLLPPTLFCIFFALPFGGDQPTETWALAKIRFWFLPRKRIWNQSGLKELVTITVPKKIEHIYTDGLSQGEVKSRLQALANTIDSRGWAIKHINAIGYLPQAANSARLIDIPNLPGEVPNGATPEDDMLDTNHNPVAQQFDTMITKSSQDRRQRLIEELQKPLPAGGTAPTPQWFMNHNPVASAASARTTPAAVATAPAAPAPLTDGQAPDTGLRRPALKNEAYSNLRTLQPLGAKTPAANDAVPPANNASGPMTAGGDPAILSLSKNNDLNVATLAREAQRAKGNGPQDEVVISLH